MREIIPKIDVHNFANPLPKSMMNLLTDREGRDEFFIFMHINYGDNENIDFYCRRPNWKILECRIKDGMIKDETGNILTNETIKPYLEAYSLGFHEGYHEFEKFVDSKIFFSGNEVKAKKIFECRHSWKSGQFSEHGRLDINYTYITKELWRKNGTEAGHYYKAWYIIVENKDVFLKYFEPIEKPKQTSEKSFSWTGSDEQKQKLYNELIKHGYIDAKTDYKDFAAIFAGDVINDNLLPVTWIKRTPKSKTIAKSEVIALFDCLANSDKIPMNETVNRAELFRKLQYCLSDEAGNPLTFEHSHTKTSKSNTDFFKQLTSSL